MTRILVLVDQAGPTLSPASRDLLAIASELGAVDALWLGDDAPVGQLGAATGLVQVRQGPTGADHELDLPIVVAEALAAAATAVAADLVLVSSTFEGKQIAARCGAGLGWGVIADAARLELADGRVRAHRTALASTWDITVSAALPAIVAMVPGSSAGLVRAAGQTPALEPAADAGSASGLAANGVGSVSGLPTADVGATRPVVEVTPEWSAAARAVRVVSRTELPDSVRPALSDARIVVVGGRGTNGDFTALEELADELGAAIGATRVATDEGWIDRDLQVGQTGVSVTPRLYIGAGVSGAVHHTGGMSGAEHIIAVNDDPDAPIFQMADLGVVGDLAEVIPAATAALRAHRQTD